MSIATIGDRANSLLLSTRSVELRTEMNRLTTELSSGQVADPATALAGNYSYYATIENDLNTIKSYETSANEARQFMSVVQASLEKFQDGANELVSSMLVVGSSQTYEPIAEVSALARGDFSEMVSLLNSGTAGRSLFAGASTDAPALAPADDIMAAFTAAVLASGAATVADIETAAENWFNDPAGFAAVAYTGSNNPLTPIRISPDATVSLDITANDEVFRDTLRYTALAALATDPVFGLNIGQQGQLISNAGQGLLGNQYGLSGLRARVGGSENRIDMSLSRLAAEKVTLDFAKNELLGADPFETATRLEEVQFRLEALYAATVRTSQLSLVNFL